MVYAPSGSQIRLDFNSHEEETMPLLNDLRHMTFAFNAASEEAFLEIRRRLIAEGAHLTEGGLVTDMGSMWSFTFYDPDGGWHEVMWVKPGAPYNSGMTRRRTTAQ
jgi:predicted lactoylglutathione lyase